MCTVHRLVDENGTILASRTMEFAADMEWKIVSVPRNRQWQSRSPAGLSGLHWKNQYGFIGIGGAGRPDTIIDGLNETGLAFSSLWFEPDIQWQDIVKNEQDRALAHTTVGSWILGNFEKVDEVKTELAKVKVFGQFSSHLQEAPPQHYIVFDASGSCIVIEYEDGQLQVYDNPLGIMTNAPNFPWHLTNVRQYIHLTNEPIRPMKFAGREFVTTAAGEGMIGLPGDSTSPSRFLKMVFLSKYAVRCSDVASLLNTAQHIVNTVDIVKGAELLFNTDGSFNYDACTQWVAFRDLTHLVYYYRTYDNPNLRKIELMKLSFEGDKVLVMPLDTQPEQIFDASNKMIEVR